MKKLINTKIIFLIIALVCGISQAGAQVNIYVSHQVSSGGNGSSGSPYSISQFTTNVLGDNATHNITGSNTINIYFERGGSYSSGSFTYGTTNGFNNTRWNNKTVTIDEYGTGTPVILDGSSNTNIFFILTRTRASGTRLTLTFKNLIIQNYSANNTNPFLYITGNYNTINFENITIRNCNNTNTGDGGYLFRFNASNANLNIKNSSIINNHRGNYIIRLQTSGSSYSTIYNNTFSGNTSPTTGIANPGFYLDLAGTSFFNNTVYNSGNITLQNSSVIFLNNLVVGTSSYSGTTSNTYRNTTYYNKNIYYNATGNLGGINITSEISSQFDTNLSGTEPGKQVHLIKDITNQNHVILNKGTLQSYLNTSTGITLAKDQLGNTRPSSSADNLRMAMGAVDTMRYYLSTEKIRISMYYNSDDNIAPSDTTINLADYILGYPINTHITNTIFSIKDSTNTNGVFDLPINSSELTFTPPVAWEDIASEYLLTYKMTNSTGDEGIGSVVIKLTNNAYPPGYTNPTDYPQTCYDYMGSVEFSSAFRFKTDGGERIYGFSIPLVGDLNGDGYPEIIAAAGTGLSANYRGILIYDGQTGTQKAYLRFTHKTSGSILSDFTVSGHHSTPSNIALVDSDRDGIVEVIVAFPNGGGHADYRNRIVSYELIPDGNTYIMNEKWKSSVYNTGNATYQKPIPQIVDIDGDGTPEVIVYNKIYNAKTGALLIELETLGTAYIGSDATTSYGDENINFSYIYDIDWDGKYDIIAGGKIYYDIDIHKTGSAPYYKIMQMSGVRDGRTGVADINGDGIPEVISVSRKSTSNTSGEVDVYVWNPDFLRLDASGNVYKNQTGTYNKEIIANCLLPLSASAQGNNSYVYIGDIDGNVQFVDGKEYRLPEIAILGGRLNFENIDQHPTVVGRGIPTSGHSATGTGTARVGAQGVLAALTWDARPGLNTSSRLKLSFVLGHDDRSINTGFTMFDFDNDGVQEICYRDEQTIRIIKATRPLVKYADTDNSVIKFSEKCMSFTGFEYPVIADIDNDASAEMIVIGRSSGGTDDAWGFVHAVGTNKEKFAPALPVWNQFMYSPLKINTDLTTPVGSAPNPLKYTYDREFRDDNGNIISSKTIKGYQPYNNNIGQVSSFLSLPNTVGGNDSFEPLIFLTEAFIVSSTGMEDHHPKITTSNGVNWFVEVSIGNKESAKTDISVNTPITLYEGSVSSTNYVKTVRLNALKNVESDELINTPIKAGETVRVKIPITNPFTVYHVRLADDSGNSSGTSWEKWRFGTNNGGEGDLGDSNSNPPEDPQLGIGKVVRAYRDCDWRDQSVKVSIAGLNPDAVTIQEFGSVMINILENDDIPNDSNAPEENKFPSNKNGFVLSNANIKVFPSAGTLTFSGKSIIYAHNGTIPENNIDMFTYKFMYKPEGATSEHEFTANVYIYILQSSDYGFGACYGNDFETKLKESPKGIRFQWWNEQNILQPTLDSLTIEAGIITSSKKYKVKPLLTFYNNDRLDFIPGDLTINVLGESIDDKATLKWTGSISSNWQDPNNWIEIKNGIELPVQYIPTSCVDIIIPTGVHNYPELKAPASCGNIYMEDRAMLSGIWYLTYDSARVDITLTAKEKNRFVMWSAPLKDTYTGDYHYKKPNSDNPAWGDVYMNFFQLGNPDYPSNPGTAAQRKNTFTATFGNIWTSLPLGTPFNLNATATSQNNFKTFSFPQRQHEKYQDINGNWSLNNPNQSNATQLARNNSHRFITDDLLTSGADTIMILPISHDAEGNQYIQLVNPFMAYLNIGSFLAFGAGQGVSNYDYIGDIRIWDGDIKGSFVSVLPNADPSSGEGRFVLRTDQWSGQAYSFIPPLQSFIAKKTAGREDIDFTNQPFIFLTPSMFTTKAAIGNYELRNETSESGVLRILAMQEEFNSSTALYFDEKASPNYKQGEDASKLFFDDFSLDLYSLTNQKEPLAINTSNSFTEVPLGLRLKNPGMVTLEFKGMDRFGHNVYLVDKELKGKDQITDLQATSNYTFTAVKPSGSTGGAFELNDRFVLRMEYTGIGNESVGLEEDLHVSSKDGYIQIQSSAPISGLQVYNINGALVYNTNSQSNFYRIPVESIQTYIVKVKCRGKYEVRKVFVK